MPIADADLESTWTSLYRCPMDDGTVAHYERRARDRILGRDADWLIDVLEAHGLVPGQRISLVGAGFGWVAEAFLARGYGPAADGTSAGRVASIDTSAWIQANKGANAAPGITILNADVNGSTGRRTIKQHFGSRNVIIDWCVTEDVLPCLVGDGPVPAGSNEIQPFCDSCRLLANNVAHWLTTGPGTHPMVNWKTLDEWKAWVTPDLVIERGAGGRVL